MLRRVVFGLLITFAAAILAIHLNGGAEPSVVEMLFTNPDGSPCERPCLFGVEIGKTKLDQVQRLLDKHPLMITKIAKGIGWIDYGTAIRVGRGALQGNWVLITVGRDDKDVIIELNTTLAP